MRVSHYDKMNQLSPFTQKRQILALLKQGENEIVHGVGHELDDVLAEADALIQSSTSTQF